MMEMECYVLIKEGEGFGASLLVELEERPCCSDWVPLVCSLLVDVYSLVAEGVGED